MSIDMLLSPTSTMIGRLNINVTEKLPPLYQIDGGVTQATNLRNDKESTTNKPRRSTSLDFCGSTERSCPDDVTQDVTGHQLSQRLTCRPSGSLCGAAGVGSWVRILLDEMKTGFRKVNRKQTQRADNIVDNYTRSRAIIKRARRGLQPRLALAPSCEMSNKNLLRRAVSSNGCEEVDYSVLFTDTCSRNNPSRKTERFIRLMLQNLDDLFSDVCPYHRNSNTNSALRDLKLELRRGLSKVGRGFGDNILEDIYEVELCDKGIDEVDRSGPPPDQSKTAINFMRLAFSKTDTADSSEQSSDVFVYYHPKNVDWITYTLIPTLEERLGKIINSKADFNLGNLIFEEKLRFIEESKYIILALSDKFVCDSDCKLFSWMAYGTKPCAVVPISLTPLHLTRQHYFFRFIIKTNGLIPWSEAEEEQPLFWEQLVDRLTDDSSEWFSNQSNSSLDVLSSILKKKFEGLPLTKRYCSCICSRADHSPRYLERRTSC